jgi:lipoate-protein ligase A
MMMAFHERMESFQAPAFMLGHFEPDTVTISKYVRIASLSDACRKGIVPVVRRMSAGDILLHLKKDVTYACSNIEKKLDVMDMLVEGIRRIGINAYSHGGTSTLVLDEQGERKIAGSAPHKVLAKCRIVHGSIFYDVPDPALLEQAYGTPAAGIMKKITCIREQRDVPLETVYSAVRSAFSEGRNVIEYTLTDTDWKAIRELAKKYASAEYLQGSGAQKDGKPCHATWGKHPDSVPHAPERLRGRIIQDT